MRTSIMRSWCLLALAACGTDGGDDVMEEDCSVAMNVDTFVVGLDKPGKSGLFDFKLMSIEPAPPARGDNTWVVQVSSMSAGVVGAPVDGATIAATPFMPSHQHGTGVTAEITPLAAPGHYQIAPVNMWMQGVWETTIRATTGTTTDTALFRFCVP